MDRGHGQRNGPIDRLRGAAITMVLLLHFGLTYRIWDHGPIVCLIGQIWAAALLRWGNFAVTAFFTVSGFLITTNALERAGALAHIDLPTFYARRFARLAPCLLLALAVIVPLGVAGVPSFAADGSDPRAGIWLGALSVLGFFHNILMQKLGYFDYCLNVYWSLSVEEVFYIGFPIACVLLRRDLSIAALCGFFILLGPIYRAVHAGNEITYLYANLACFDAISIGCLTALLAQRWQPSRQFARMLLVLGWIALAAVWLRGFGGGRVVLSFTSIALSAAAIIIGGLSKHPQASPVFPDRALQWLGRHSYELYLFHIIVLAAMRDAVPSKALSNTWQMPWLALYLALACAAAFLAAQAVGDPANRMLRQRLLQSRRRYPSSKSAAP